MRESLNKIYEELINRLYKPLIFYIPSKLFTDLAGIQWSNKEIEECFDKLVLIKSNGVDKVLGDDPSYFFILGKTQVLEKNIFSLLSAKSDYDVTSFNFLISKYRFYLDFYVRISTWLYDNVEKDIEGLSYERLTSFQYQKEAFLKHRAFVLSNFIDSKSKIEKNNNDILTNEDVKSIKDLLKSGDDKELSNIKAFEKSTEVLKNKNKVLVTDDEADSLLLKTVFNLDV